MPAAAATIENVDRDEDGLAIQRKAQGVLINIPVVSSLED